VLPVLDPVAVRRVVVARQGFAARPRRATVAEVYAAIERLGCVQLDSVTAVARAHLLTLSARVGRLPPGALNALRADGRVFEYWAHEACLIPTADYPLFRLGRRRAHPWFSKALDEHPDIADRILADIAASGPTSARAYGGAGSGYWEWTPTKRVIEALWTRGDLAVATRRGFERIYDLSERVIPAAALTAPEPDDEELQMGQVRRTLRARGVVTRMRLADYYRVAGGERTLRRSISALVEGGEAVEARLGDWPVLLDPAAAATLESPPTPVTPVLLCPFDNMIWDREETARIFGFRHALEIYKRPHERIWGYYVLPLLVGDRIVGRVDLKSDRAGGLLRPLAVHWERRPARRALEQALARLAHALELQPAPLPS